jgi:competence protein ComEC
MHLTFLDVGSADAILIQTPKGRSVLIGGGPSTSRLSDQLGRRLPFVRRKLDWLVIAATSEQQVAALPRVLERYPPEQVLWSGNMQASFSARQVDIWLAERGVPVMHAELGQRLDLGDGAFLELLSVGPRGSVLLLDWHNFRAVLPVGVDSGTLSELEFGIGLGAADVLLLGDSGFAPTNPPAWIENLNPQLVVLSVAAGDIDGLPEQETLDSLAGYSLLRTDRNGWISVATDGQQMRVEVAREGAPGDGT